MLSEIHAEEAGQMESIRKRKWPWAVLIPLAVTTAAIHINIGMFFWGSAPEWYNVLASIAYLMFWGGYRALCSGTSGRRMFCAFGIGTMLNGLVALPVVAWQSSALADVFTGPAILLSMVFTAPVTGMACLLHGHTVRWLAVAILGAVWTVVGLFPVRRSN